MSKGKQHIGSLWIAFFLILNIWACQKVEDIPSPNEITKAQRTLLGQTMRDAILTDSTFNIVSKTEARYKPTYAFLQQLYNQAYFFLRHDAIASKTDQWDRNREWELFVIESDQKNAFCLPGGDFFITTSFLQTLNHEYELFYVMTFEAVLMNERYLLNQLIPFANSTSGLLEITAEGINNTGITTDHLIADLTQSNTYTTSTIQEIDTETNATICQSSLFSRLAIIPILNQLDNNDTWLQNRPSYSNRTNYIINDIDLTSANCGTRKWAVQQSDYQDFTNPLP